MLAPINGCYNEASKNTEVFTMARLVGQLNPNYKHGGKARFPKEYKTWNHINGRCYCKTNHKYPLYGGRGITVWDAWRSDFSQFLSDMGRAPTAHHSIERIDNSGHYEPNNCKWALPQAQANNRRSSRHITYKGETKTIAQWARKIDMKQATLRARIEVSGMSVEEAIETPIAASNRVEYSHNGITDSISGWSRRLGFGKNTINERMRRGMSFEDAISSGYGAGAASEVFTYKGVTKTMAQWSRHTGIHQGTLRRRLKVQGMTIKDALERPLKPKKTAK